MAITTQAGLIAAMEAGEQLAITRTSVGNITTPTTGVWCNAFNNGDPVGVIAGTSTAAGVVPTDATAGCPVITDFGGGKTGYLGGVSFFPMVNPASAVSCHLRCRLHDMLFKAGAYSFNSNVTLAAQPSYSGRIPGSDYKGTELWVESVTAFTGSPTITFTYTNQDGTAGKSTSISPPGFNSSNRMMQVPLASGDTGIQKVESVVATVATVGTFNVLVLRPLWMGCVAMGEELTHAPDLTDLPILFDSSALVAMFQGESNPAGLAVGQLLTVING